MGDKSSGSDFDVEVPGQPDPSPDAYHTALLCTTRSSGMNLTVELVCMFRMHGTGNLFLTIRMMGDSNMQRKANGHLHCVAGQCQMNCFTFVPSSHGFPNCELRHLRDPTKLRGIAQDIYKL